MRSPTHWSSWWQPRLHLTHGCLSRTFQVMSETLIIASSRCFWAHSTFHVIMKQNCCLPSVSHLQTDLVKRTTGPLQGARNRRSRGRPVQFGGDPGRRTHRQSLGKQNISTALKVLVKIICNWKGLSSATVKQLLLRSM